MENPRYASNTLGLSTCMSCGAVVVYITLHNKFHAEFKRVEDK